MNHKRKKCKRSVRCTMCTQNRWRGNNKDRFKAKDQVHDKYIHLED